MTDFLHRDLDFSQPTPMGFCVCARCGEIVTKEQWATERCTAVPCRCGHGEASHHHLEHCTHEDCVCRRYVPAEETA